MVRSAVPGGTPTPLEALPWGSMSMSSVRRSAAARLAARFTAVVVLPTPPFWLAMAMICWRWVIGKWVAENQTPRTRDGKTDELGTSLPRQCASYRNIAREPRFFGGQRDVAYCVRRCRCE